MTYHVVALAIIFFFGALAYFSRASLYSPLVISCFSWFIVFALGLFFYDNFFPLQTRAFIAWLIWFLVTTFLNNNLVAKVARQLYKLAFLFPKEVWFLNSDDQDAFLSHNLVDKNKAVILRSEG